MKLEGPVAIEPILGSQGVQILPLELWSHIFHHIPRRRRQPVTLVCRTFRWLAQPLLFEKINLTRLRGFDALNDRLKFITSPRIASAVLVCLPTHYRLHPTFSCIVLNALPHFSNLLYLRLCGFIITESLLEALSGFRRPPDLHFMSAMGEVDKPPPMRPSIPLRYLNLGAKVANDITLAAVSPILVHPTQTHTLQLEFGSDAVYGNLVNTGSVFALRSLGVRCCNTVSPEFTAFLDACPALEELRIGADSRPHEYHKWSKPFGTPSQTALPRLRVFQGPLCAVEAFTRDRPVAHLVIWGFDEKEDGMIQMLAALGARYPIESLGLHLRNFTSAVAGALTTMSVIRALSVSMADNPVGRSAYSIIRAMNIPSTLEYFSCAIPGRETRKSFLRLFPKEKYPHLRYLRDHNRTNYNPATGEVVGFNCIENWQRNNIGLGQPFWEHDYNLE